jgi:hypothetical protein
MVKMTSKKIMEMLYLQPQMTKLCFATPKKTHTFAGYSHLSFYKNKLNPHIVLTQC